MIYFTNEYASDAAAAGLPMTHARILWDNLPGTITASSEAEGRAAERAGQIDTASWWEPTSAPGWWQIDFGSAKPVDAVGIAAHELDGAAVLIEVKVGGSWVEAIEIEPSTRAAIMTLTREKNATAIRVTSDKVAKIGVIYAGKALAMPRAGYSSLGMVDLGRDATLTSYVSEGGQLLKRSIQRSGLSAECSWDHLPEDWYRQTFDPFALRARTEPFFLASRPSDYPRDCAYCWVDAPIVPSRMGIKNFLSAGFTVKAHAHE